MFDLIKSDRVIIKPLKKETVTPAPVHYLPSISIVMPFEPVAQSKSQIEQKLTAALHKVEKELNHQFSKPIARSAVSKLKSIIGALNYSSLKKSIFISLSPFQEQVHYLNVPLREKVVVGQPLQPRELLQLKKEERRYLLLVLDDKKAHLYLGDQHQLTLLMHNSQQQKAARAGADESTAPGTEKLPANSFLKYVDNGLHIVLQSYPLPLLVMGCKNHLDLFGKLTQSKNHLVQLIEKEVAPGSKHCLHQAVQPYITVGWHALHEKYLVRQLEQALATGRIAVGIDEVWKAAHEKRCRLMVIEKDYAYPSYPEAADAALLAGMLCSQEAAPPADAVEEAIEKVLAGGGNVEWVEKGVLKDYLHVALI